VNEKHPVRSTDEHTVGRAWYRPSSRSGARSSRPLASPHVQRFRMVQSVLVGLGVAAILIALLLAAHGRTTNTASFPWSSWTPPDQGTQGALDIASHVAPDYRLTPAQQLSVITVINLESPNAQAATAAAEASGLNPKPSIGLQIAVKASESSSSVSLLNGSTIAYNLCGVGGKDCAIGVGTPSANRLLLLRREALELALYTLKYLKGVQNVVTVLPPGRMQVTSQLTKSLPTSNSRGSAPVHVALLFDRQELAPLLQNSDPLAATLPEPVPPTVAQMGTAREAELVNLVTGHGMFTEQIQNAQDGSTVIVLTPLPPQ
jgi:hypothetical protein